MKKIISLFIVILFISSSLIISSTASKNDIKEDDVHKKYAVLWVGSYIGTLKDISYIQTYYHWYLNDVGKIYTTLRDIYGFDEENIFLLVKENPKILGLEIPETFNFEWKDFDSNEKNLKFVLNKCRDELDSDDTLFLYFLNHGASSYDGGVVWTNPNGFIEGNWKNEELVYDDDTLSFSSYNENIKSNWSDYITIKLNKKIDLRGFRVAANNHKIYSFKNKKNNNIFDLIEFNFYCDDELLNTSYLNSWPFKKNDMWEYYRFEDCEIPKNVNQVKIRFHENSEKYGFKKYPIYLYEFDLWSTDDGYDLTETSFQFPFNSIFSFIKWLFYKPDQQIRDIKLKEYLQDISADMMMILHPCRAGGFIDDLSGENRVILTGGRGAEYGPAGWVGYIRKALEKIDQNQDGIYDADYDNNKKISMYEVYKYAAIKVKNWLSNPNYKYLRQHPLIDDNSDGRGHHLDEEGFFNFDDCSKDGYYASNFYLE